MMRVAAALANLVVCASGLFAVPAGAQPPGTRQAPTLSWQRLPGAESCPALRQVASRVDAHLGGFGLVSPSEARSFVDASVEPVQPSGFRVRITLSDEVDTVLGVRELVEEAGDCARVVDAAALAIALLIDPDAGTRDASRSFESPRDKPSAPAMPATAGSRPAPMLPVPSAAAAEPERPPGSGQSRWRTRVSVGGLAAVGQLPNVAWGVLGGVRLAPEGRGFGVDVLGLYLAREREEIRPDAGGQFAAAAAALSGFWVPLRERQLAFSVGVGAQVGRIAASGFGFTGANHYAQSWLINTTLDLELSWRAVEPWGVLLRSSLGVPLWRDRFEVTPNGRPTDVFRAAPVVGFLSVGLLVEP
jgi:hypothetical protein